MSPRTFNFPQKLAPTGAVDVDLLQAHTHSSNHRDDLLQSESCGCFHCLAIFTVVDIQSWTDEVDGVSVTALCPKCGLDAVLGSSSGYPVEESFLRRMQEHFCHNEDE